jgi:hypothetical protein
LHHWRGAELQAGIRNIRLVSGAGEGEIGEEL